MSELTFAEYEKNKRKSINDATPEEWNRAAAKQIGGTHYDLTIQPIDYIMKNGLGYCEGNVVKYITRHQDKGGPQDIHKAIHYCQFILRDVYGEDI